MGRAPVNGQGSYPTDPVGPLEALTAGLGRPDFDWARRERLWSIDAEFMDIDRATLEQLSPANLNACVSTYGAGIAEFAFYTGTLLELDCRHGVTQSQLDALSRSLRGTARLRFRFELDKKQLLAEWFGDAPDNCMRYLYLFKSTFGHFLALASLRDLEALWADAPEAKVVIFVAAYEHVLDGPLLSIVGTLNQAPDWRSLVPSKPYSKERLNEIAAVRTDVLNWEESWVDFLTPLHLDVGAKVNSRVGVLLTAHWVNAVILYTAGRVTGRARPAQGCYVSPQQTVCLPLIEPASECLATEQDKGLLALRQLWEWSYEKGFAADRLDFVQILVGQSLSGVEPGDRCRALLSSGPAVYEGLRWHWRAFVEKKIEGYTDRVRELEDYVDKTVDAYADQVDKLIQGMAETLLTAVAAVLGTLVASLFGGEIDPFVFAIGMSLYALYVYVFPYRFRSRSQREHFSITTDGFRRRRQEFERYLYERRVEELIGDRVSRSQDRFRQWDRRATRTYRVVLGIAVAAAVLSSIAAVL